MNDPETHLPLFLLLSSLTEQATRDWLTGLYNRRYFEETLSDHIELAKRYNRELSLVLFDINDFKAINDAKGHEAGDNALKEFADLLKSTARAADITCRFGGDEFAVILPETSLESSQVFAERVLKSSTIPATYGASALPSENLIETADKELLSKKGSSRQPQNR